MRPRGGGGSIGIRDHPSLLAPGKPRRGFILARSERFSPLISNLLRLEMVYLDLVHP